MVTLDELHDYINNDIITLKIAVLNEIVKLTMTID